MFFSNTIILGLLAATYAFQSGVAARAINVAARSTDITCGGQFPQAGDGYARRPDGCSSWSDNPAQVRDKWGSANFGGVCDDHDRCYYTRGANVDACNNNFCDGLRNACHHAYCNRILGCLPGVYDACTAIADTYCAAVRVAAPSVYKKAQNLQESYETCITDNGGIVVPPPPVLCSNGQPEGATWEDIFDGMRCTKTMRGCRNGQIVLISENPISPCIEV